MGVYSAICPYCGEPCLLLSFNYSTTCDCRKRLNEALATAFWELHFSEACDG